MEGPAVQDPRRIGPVAWGGLALALAALTARFVALLDASFAYDEATYVELAAHPWHSSYYPDTVFLRHPPLAFLLMGLWGAVAGTGEAAMRLLSVLLAGGATVLVWDAVRRLGGPPAAGLAGLLLAGAFTVLAYAVQATLYPVAFLAVALAVHGRARGSGRQERAGLAAFALTHLFGFLFLALHLLQERRAWRQEWPWAVAPALWLLGAGAAALLLNPAGDIMRLGPSGQALRSLFVLDDALRDWRLHVVVGFLGLVLLNPALLREAWAHRRPWGPWVLGGVLLMAYLFVAPAYVRYGLLLIPVVLAAGLPPLLRHGDRRHVWTVVAFAALALPSGVVYVVEGPDPHAAVDLPDGPDWRRAATEVAGGGAVATPVPTSLAFYLERDHGYHVVDALGGPYVLRLAHPDGRTLTVHAITRDGHLPLEATQTLLPQRWEARMQDLEEQGWRRCGGAEDPVLLCRSGALAEPAQVLPPWSIRTVMPP